MQSALTVTKEEQKPFGRPTLYKPEYVQRAREMCEQGATDAELAKEFGVTVRTIFRWADAHPDFCQAIQDAKDNADDKVEASLYQKALGYERAVQKATASGAVVDLKEFFPPDTAAAFIWLKNRRSQKWKDRQTMDVNHTFTLSQQFESFIGEIKHDDAPGLINANAVEAEIVE